MSGGAGEMRAEEAVGAERIGVVGLGYVGLPVATLIAQRHPGTVGYDVDRGRVERIRAGADDTGEVSREELVASGLHATNDPADLDGTTFFIVAVPTPIDEDRRPNLEPLRSACEAVGRALRPGGLVVFESTVYPGVTEEFCGPILERVSGLAPGVDFKLGYSPERINPGDREHTLARIVKVVSAQDESALARVCAVYGSVVEAGLHKAPSIRVAEAAKVIENTQRDLNIAFVNELSMILDRLDVPTRDVLAAARTKWNFLDFKPGLVGGHCIGVDPYYLTALAERIGYHPQVILAGRRINDGMGSFIAQKLVKLVIRSGRPVAGGRVGILGLTFKEDVPDLRNSRVVDIVAELREFGMECLVHDAAARPEDALREHGVTLRRLEELDALDALVLAVPHRAYRETPPAALLARVREGGVVVDVKSILDPADVPPGLTYWSL
ncbi:nucleotide sugar dehydrogenase [Salinarimonas sp. NSM]|uniref:nucleotide sugar dehydrogenase n=1 Tax=Salinarimonas sp. NSM TaxID=3458003 RepID=UPI004034F7CE